jgi:hypothetical protein
MNKIAKPLVIEELRAMRRQLQDKATIVDAARFSDAIDKDRFNELDAELNNLNADINAFCRVIAHIVEVE